MAICFEFECDSCGMRKGAWSDGNPYFINDLGQKAYAYHPNHDLLEKCIGNDVPHLCLGCGEEFDVDSRAPVNACPKCASTRICDSCELDGKPCPACQSGIMVKCEGHRFIS
jgi:DNA-directed RNA polymerase subunit RPC12/RpoP